MKMKKYCHAFFRAALLGALLLPLGAAAQVEEARVRIDGMFCPL